jgi:hypothetical protein
MAPVAPSSFARSTNKTASDSITKLARVSLFALMNHANDPRDQLPRVQGVAARVAREIDYSADAMISFSGANEAHRVPLTGIFLFSFFPSCSSRCLIIAPDRPDRSDRSGFPLTSLSVSSSRSVALTRFLMALPNELKALGKDFFFADIGKDARWVLLVDSYTPLKFTNETPTPSYSLPGCSFEIIDFRSLR